MMCRIDGAAPAQVYREKIVKAREPHRCGECLRGIGIGETYRYVFMIYDGYADSYCTCQHCCAAQDWLARECGGYIFSQVAEELEEHAFDYPTITMPLRKLIAGIKRQWRWFNGEMMGVPPVPPAQIAHHVLS